MQAHIHTVTMCEWLTPLGWWDKSIRFRNAVKLEIHMAGKWRNNVVCLHEFSLYAAICFLVYNQSFSFKIQCWPWKPQWKKNQTSESLLVSSDEDQEICLKVPIQPLNGHWTAIVLATAVS